MLLHHPPKFLPESQPPKTPEEFHGESRARTAANVARLRWPGPIGEALADRCREVEQFRFLPDTHGATRRLVDAILDGGS